MAKFHVTPTGVLPCNDNTGRCPYLKGEKNNHFHDPVKAEAEFADRMVAENGQFATATRKTQSVQTANDLRARMGTPVATSSPQYRTSAMFTGVRTGSRTGFATRVSSGAAPSKAANVMARSLSHR